MRLKKCPDFEKILDYLQDLLPNIEKSNLESHIKECTSCPATLAEARQLLTFLAEDAKLNVSATAHNRAIAFFQPWFQTQQQLKTAPTGLKKWIASLILDTRQAPGLAAPAMAGLRSAAIAASPYQLLYSADEGRIEIDLQIQPAGSGGKKSARLMMGQVMGLENPSCRVELVAADFSSRETTVDETFTFRFSDIPVGIYFLNIYSDNQLFEIPVMTL